MKKRTITIFLYDIIYDDRTTETTSFTKMELAAFKRSNKKKKVITMKKLFQLDINIKSLNK